MSDIILKTHLSPEEASWNDELSCALNRRAPELIREWHPAVETLTQRLLREDVDSSWPRPIRDWYEARTSWLPPDLLEWWDEQQVTNPEVDRMPYEWWMSEADVVVSAWSRERPVGVDSLVDVYLWKDRRNYSSGSDATNGGDPMPYFQEVRGLVVDKACRGNGVGALVLRQTLAIAHERRLPIVAITTNPQAARLFERHGAHDGTSAPHSLTYPIPPELACWGDRRQDAERCEFCPRVPGRMWVWPMEFQ